MGRVPKDPPLDLAGLARQVADAVAAEEARRLDDTGYGDVRPSHAAVLDAVATGHRTAATIGPSLGVSPQAVSKTAAELLVMGYLDATVDAHDRRQRALGLTARGTAFAAARAGIRTAITREQHRWLGTRDSAELARLLTALGELHRDSSD
jgi:DNA-binding MarR family transcriptional regulator